MLFNFLIQITIFNLYCWIYNYVYCLLLYESNSVLQKELSFSFLSHYNLSIKQNPIQLASFISTDTIVLGTCAKVLRLHKKKKYVTKYHQIFPKMLKTLSILCILHISLSSALLSQFVYVNKHSAPFEMGMHCQYVLWNPDELKLVSVRSTSGSLVNLCSGQYIWMHAIIG